MSNLLWNQREWRHQNAGIGVNGINGEKFVDQTKNSTLFSELN